MASRPVYSYSLLVLLCCCFNAVRAAAEYSPSALATHLDTLLAEYERDVPPAARVLVALALDVRHASVHDASATMRLLADLKMSWADPRTAWNASSWGGESALVSAERLWVPDVGPVGGAALSAGGAAGAGAGARARLASDGSVSLVARLDLTVPLALRLRDWPRDHQLAVYEFASREYDQDELDLVIGDFKNAVVVECGAWEVASVSGATRAWRRGRGEGGGVARVAAWSVRAARRCGALRVAAGAALLAAALLLAAAAARPPAARAPLAAAAAALCAAWLVAAMFHVPAGAGAPLAVRLVAACCVTAAAAGAGAALAGHVARRTAPPSAALRALLSRVSAVYALTPHTECGAGAGAGGECGAWAAAAALLDAVLLALLLLALLVITALFFC